MTSNRQPHIIVALTGASGTPYALRTLHRLREAGAQLSIVCSEAACVTLAAEKGIKVAANSVDLSKLFGAEISADLPIKYYGPKQIAAPIASGSHMHDCMIVVPCSMGTLGRIAHGIADDLIARAADVTLKERRKLILVTREMPLSLIHLKNMQAATEAGAIIMHACPHFYHRPQTVEEVVDTVVDRILDHAGVESDIKRWKAIEPQRRRSAEGK